MTGQITENQDDEKEESLVEPGQGTIKIISSITSLHSSNDASDSRPGLKPNWEAR